MSYTDYRVYIDSNPTDSKDRVFCSIDCGSDAKAYSEAVAYALSVTGTSRGGRSVRLNHIEVVDGREYLRREYRI